MKAFLSLVIIGLGGVVYHQLVINARLQDALTQEQIRSSDNSERLVSAQEQIHILRGDSAIFIKALADYQTAYPASVFPGRN